MARWQRARRLLGLPEGSHVLDLGCAFGYGTRLFASRYDMYGHDLSSEYIARARHTSPGLTFTCGAADRIPYPDHFFDGILLLDVLEHVPDERSVMREITRVLRPGGTLILSVPNRGALAGLDSLNVYRAWLGANAPHPTDDPSWPERPHHKHYALTDIRHMVEPIFAIKDVRYSGLGIAEPVNLALLLVFRALFRAPKAYALMQYIYFSVYLAEDLIETGPFGYHMMVKLERV